MFIKLRNRGSDSDSNKSGNSQSSRLSLDESPPYERRKSNPGLTFKNKFSDSDNEMVRNNNYDRILTYLIRLR